MAIRGIASALCSAVTTPGPSVVGTAWRSVSLGPLGALRTRGAAGGLVVGVDAQPGLNNHHAVVASVPAVLICSQRGRREDGWPGTRRRSHMNTRVTHTHTHLRLVDCRVWCCRAAPAQVWGLSHSQGCAFCPELDTAPPSFGGLFHRSASTEDNGSEGK